MRALMYFPSGISSSLTSHGEGFVPCKTTGQRLRPDTHPVLVPQPTVRIDGDSYRNRPAIAKRRGQRSLMKLRTVPIIVVRPGDINRCPHPELIFNIDVAAQDSGEAPQTFAKIARCHDGNKDRMALAMPA